MKVFIVRHGQVPNNALRRHTNPYEDLTELGVSQAEELREKIKNINFDIIYVSPYLRARHTAEIINSHNVEMVIDERLKERDIGMFSNQPLESDAEREDYWDYYLNEERGDAEKIVPFFERVYSFLDDLKEKDYQNVLVVAHSGVTKAFIAYFDGIQDGKFLDKGLKNCEIKEYELGGKDGK